MRIPATEYLNAARDAHIAAVAFLNDQPSDCAAATAVAYTAQVLFDAEEILDSYLAGAESSEIKGFH